MKSVGATAVFAYRRGTQKCTKNVVFCAFFDIAKNIDFLPASR
jgi:hypothetical protein